MGMSSPSEPCCLPCPSRPAAFILLLQPPGKGTSTCNLSRATSLNTARRRYSRSKLLDLKHFHANFAGATRPRILFGSLRRRKLPNWKQRKKKFESRGESFPTG